MLTILNLDTGQTYRVLDSVNGYSDSQSVDVTDNTLDEGRSRSINDHRQVGNVEVTFEGPISETGPDYGAGGNGPERVQWFLEQLEALRDTYELLSVGTLYRTYQNVTLTLIETSRSDRNAKLNVTLRFRSLNLAVSAVSSVPALPRKSSKKKGQQAKKNAEESQEVIAAAANKKDESVLFGAAKAAGAI